MINESMLVDVSKLCQLLKKYKYNLELYKYIYVCMYMYGDE